MGWLPRCVYYIHLQSPMAWNQESLAIRTTLGSTRFGNPSVQNQAEGVDQWHSQEPYSGTHDFRNLCCWISKAWATACTHFHLLYQRPQATHGRGCRPHDQCWTSEFRNKQVGPQDGCQIVVRIHIVIQHTSLTYHTHIHTQTHNMDESIHKYMCTTTENVTRKIYYHKTRDAYTYSQAKPTPLREFRPMLTGHHSSKLH
jgi:hypothetical protein